MILPVQYFYAMSSLFGFKQKTDQILITPQGNIVSDTVTVAPLFNMPAVNDVNNGISIQDTFMGDLGFQFLEEPEESRFQLPWWYEEWKGGCDGTTAIVSESLAKLTCRQDPLHSPSRGYNRYSVQSAIRGSGHCHFWLGPSDFKTSGEPLAVDIPENRRCPPWRIRDPDGLCRRVWLCVFPESENERMMKRKCPNGEDCLKHYVYN